MMLFQQCLREPEALICLRDMGQIDDPLSKNLVWRWSPRKNPCFK